MSGASSIEWTDKTWNPVTGCSKVSEGCRNCYAETISLRFKRSVGPWNAVNAPENVILHPDRLTAPLRWKEPSLVFVNSMSDLFHELVPDEFIARVWDVMVRSPQHTFQVLTKRPERMARVLGPNGIGFYAKEGPVPCPQPNIWIGTSVENQKAADERIPHLLNTPAAVRFLSCEPLLGPLDLEKFLVHYDRNGEPWTSRGDIHWVITGGESGHGARLMDAEWARSLRDQCYEAGVPFFFKQAGAVLARQWGCSDGKGHKLDEIPEDLRIRQFPPTLEPVS